MRSCEPDVNSDRESLSRDEGRDAGIGLHPVNDSPPSVNAPNHRVRGKKVLDLSGFRASRT